MDSEDRDIAIVDNLYSNTLHKEALQALEGDTVAWLQRLNGPTWIDIAGRDTSRVRVIVTLLHGNEPSGIIALHRWLQQQIKPCVNLSILVASVEAALTPPIFSHRMLPHKRDLNRCFKAPFTDAQGRLAQAIIKRVRELQPECVVDIHNTSGTGPSFAVAIDNHYSQHALARWFCQRMIVTDFRLGSLMEIDCECPTITIECGGAQDKESEAVAYNGISRLALEENIFSGSDSDLEILHHPVRVELNPDTSIVYADQVSAQVDITLWSDIEHRNHGITPAESCLGWVGVDGLHRLAAKNAEGVDQLPKLLREVNGWLYPARNLRLFMATTNATIARSDCLFYAVPA